MNILVPTDFSQYANYAFDVACQIALSTDANLHLYHNVDIPDDWEGLEAGRKDSKNKPIAISARQRLLLLKEAAQEKGIQSAIHYSNGNFIDKLEEVIKKVKINLIVMGSHGVSGAQELVIGSKTQKVVRKIHEDLLVVKEPTPEFQPKSAVFVSSLNIEDQDAFRSFLDYTDSFGIKELHVLTIDTSAWFTQPYRLIVEVQKDFQKIAEGRNCLTHFYKNHTVLSGVNDFIILKNIDLTAISYHTRNPLKRIFLGSNVEMLINHTNRPVLCINT